MMTSHQMSFENVENLLKLTVDKICKNFSSFMNSRIVSINLWVTPPAIVGLRDKSWHPLKTGPGSGPKPLRKQNPIFADT